MEEQRGRGATPEEWANLMNRVSPEQPEPGYLASISSTAALRRHHRGDRHPASRCAPLDDLLTQDGTRPCRNNRRRREPMSPMPMPTLASRKGGKRGRDSRLSAGSGNPGLFKPAGVGRGGSECAGCERPDVRGAPPARAIIPPSFPIRASTPDRSEPWHSSEQPSDSPRANPTWYGTRPARYCRRSGDAA